MSIDTWEWPISDPLGINLSDTFELTSVWLLENTWILKLFICSHVSCTEGDLWNNPRNNLEERISASAVSPSFTLTCDFWTISSSALPPLNLNTNKYTFEIEPACVWGFCLLNCCATTHFLVRSITIYSSTGFLEPLFLSCCGQM